MAHLTIQYSPRLEAQIDMQHLCESLRQVMIDQGIFPEGGIRVRAWPTPHAAIADLHTDNVYADLQLRMGQGRSMEQKKAAGAAIMEAAEAAFAGVLATPHMALALEIIEIDKELSWKTNSIHPRLKVEG